jgi:exopolysaccharide biosynthesis polyprenyl glycosylphosphotransferase
VTSTPTPAQMTDERPTTAAADARRIRAATRTGLGWRRFGPLLTDIVAVATTIALVENSVLGRDPGHVEVLGAPVPYPLYSATLAFLWIVALTTGATRSTISSIDTSASYRRAVQVSVLVFLGMSVFAHFLKSEVSRIYTVLVFVIGLVGLLLGRFCWNVSNTVLRASGRSRIPVVLAEVARPPAHPAQGIRAADTWYGLQIVESVTVPDLDRPDAVTSMDRWVRTTVEAVRSSGVRFLVVGSRLAGNRLAMQRLAWAMEGTGADLMLSPQFGLVGRRRIEMVSLDEQKWVHVRVAGSRRVHRLAKRLVDVVVSVLGLVVLGPVMLLIAVLVRRGDDGPALFMQQRIGRDGRPFTMLKFRSMRTRASASVDAVLSNEADGPLFKMREDPRVTPIGRVLRRYSLDELPQLVNVMRGDMSIVGPRPALPAEVECYGQAERRRLLMTPGLTGPWQVGGRSDLSWEESIRMDLSYVENWTLTEDLAIILRTFGAVLRARGAY